MPGTFKPITFKPLSFKIARWSAWAPGLTDLSAWLAWSKGERELSGMLERLPVEKPVVTGLPSALRRRCSRPTLIAAELLTRCGIVASAPCSAGGDSEAVRKQPSIVFSSRHGEAQTTERILRALAGSEAVSPTDFMLSVHNTTAGLISLGYGLTAPNTALAAGRSTIAAGILESIGLLREGTEEVVLVHTDDPLPEVFRGTEVALEPPLGIALVMQPAQEDVSADKLNDAVTLEWRAQAGGSGEGRDHWGLLRWLLGSTGHCCLSLQEGALILSGERQEGMGGAFC